MATIDTLRTKVAIYLNRAVSDLFVNGVDLVLDAANDAVKNAQRMLDFEYARTQIDLSVDMTTGADLDDATVIGGSFAIVVNKIERAYVIMANGVSRPIELVSRSIMNHRLGRNWDNQMPWQDWARANGQSMLTLPSDAPVLVREADKIFLWPNDASIYGGNPTNVGMDVIQWMRPFTSRDYLVVVNGSTTGPIPTGTNNYYLNGSYNGAPLYQYGTIPSISPYYIWYSTSQSNWVASSAPGVVTPRWNCDTNGVDALLDSTWTASGFVANGSLTITTAANSAINGHNFFTDYCEDWLFWAILRQLHYFIKDEKRGQEVHRLYGETWAGVISWNSSIGDAEEEDVTLD